MAVVLADLLEEKNVVLALTSATREEALREIIAAMAHDDQLREPDKFAAEVLTREETTSTYVGHGVAFPHARTDLVAEIVLGIGRSEAGVLFGEKEEPAHLLFVIAVPRRMVSDYLVCIGALARLTKAKETREALMRAATAEEFVAILRSGSLLLE